MPPGHIAAKRKSQGIGLALSGGGFRASIFHLGVIRRLEELGMMQDVSVISTVSGGSIIGAYYVVEMERRLRDYRNEFRKIETSTTEAVERTRMLRAAVTEARVRIFETIANDFFSALDHNIRSRSIVFGPFYHPVLFLRSWWPTCSRSDVIQREYDRFFFKFHPLDQLPSVTDGQTSCDYLAGPRLVINATCLLTGERHGFSRAPISGVSEMNRPNTNVLLLSRVVGASAGVPGLFPPTPIFGRKFVDGGVSDNQGLDGLLDDGRAPQSPSTGSDNAKDESPPALDYDAIIVSDASGQLEPIHGIKDRASKVLPRTFSIFQHELRNKTIRRLLAWRRGDECQEVQFATGRERVAESPGSTAEAADLGAAAPREFAYVHLYLNLKHRTVRATDERYRVSHRVPSEYIQSLGRIRTDLDQFSFVEREALMYHGYTSVDAQLRRWCPRLLDSRLASGQPAPPLREAPLFAGRSTQARPQTRHGMPASASQDAVLEELRAASQPAFLLRVFLKHRLLAAGTYLLCFVLPLVLVGVLLLRTSLADWLQQVFGTRVEAWWANSSPRWLHAVFEWLGGLIKLPMTTKGIMVLCSSLLAAYVFLWLTFVVTRRWALRWDRQAYVRVAGTSPSLAWSHPGAPSGVAPDVR